jgi:phage terminase large subunit-like protein
MLTRVSDYAEAVLCKKIIAGPHVRDACRRHMRDLKRSDIWFDSDKSTRVFKFYENCLKLSEGQFEDKPFKLHTSQCFIIGSLFGWHREATDGGTPVRRFRRAYIEQGKGNGKSPLVGGIGLYGMSADNEPGAQIYSAGATREQAGILFQDAVRMASKAPMLDCRITFHGNLVPWAMSMRKGKQAGSKFMPLSRQAGKTGSGPRPHMALCDEVHEHPDRNIMEMLERGFKFRRQPLLVMITNSGTDRNSICWEEHEHAIAVARGEIEDDEEFAYVCALDKKDKPLDDPTCWVKANPLLGVTITDEYLHSVVKQAKQIPGKANAILRLHFCVWTDAISAWLPREAWEAIEDETLDIKDFLGGVCSTGLDLSQTRDLTARALVFEDGFTEAEEDGKILPKFAAFVYGYTPKQTLLDRVEKDRAPYDQWIDQGFLKATPGPSVRLDIVAADCVEDCQIYDVQNIAYDKYLYRRFEDAVNEIGAVLPTIEHPQGIARRQNCDLWMPGSIDQLEELIASKRLRVHVNPALRSAVASATFFNSPAGLRRFEKSKARNKIDMLVALTQAVGAAMIPYKDNLSVYDRLAKLPRENSVSAGVGIDYEVLNDPSHPEHSLMLAAFKRLQEDNVDEDF